MSNRQLSGTSSSRCRIDRRNSDETRSAMEKLEYASTDEVEVLAVDRSADPRGAVSFTQHRGSVESYIARLRQTGIGTRTEFGAHGVAAPHRGDVDPFRHSGHLTVEQKAH